ncbi:hypothetical protein ABT279_36615, partial [Amycolatopsis sp. NPDC000673]|uniref:hypothetical protein n=1 Tax=Amycolatopsis sp. NPDC000673 TaxID=3154267 RepID=UPI00331B825D
MDPWGGALAAVDAAGWLRGGMPTRGELRLAGAGECAAGLAAAVAGRPLLEELEQPSFGDPGPACPGLASFDSARPRLAWLGSAWPRLAWPGLARPGPACPGLASFDSARPRLAWLGSAWPRLAW